MLWVITTKSTSKYEGVSWNEKVTLWRAMFYFNGKQSKYYFDNEHDAAETRNQVYKKMEILPQNPGNSEIPNRHKKVKVSQYKGVYYHKNADKWYALLNQKRENQKYGGLFENELNAAQRVNQLCDELKIPQKNPGICGITTRIHQKKEKTSKYKGVYWEQLPKKWRACLYLQKGKKRFDEFGGYFNDELDAAKKVNQLCEEMEIPYKNPEILGIPHQQLKKRGKASQVSQYIGVYWYKQTRKWCVHLNLTGEKQKNGGFFEDELDAAKRVNQICKEMEIPYKNPGISAMPNQQWKPKQKGSQFHGVSWSRQVKKWQARIYLPKGKRNHGGNFDDELDAAKGVNKLCEEMEIPHKNPGISAIPNQQCRSRPKTSQYKGVHLMKASGKWYSRLCFNLVEYRYGGFNEEVYAAKRVNQLCEELEIPLRNPGLTGEPNEQLQPKQNTSQFKGVHRDNKNGKWYTQLNLKGRQKKYGGYFNDELDAGKRVNQICEEFGIPHKNTGISAIPIQEWKQKTNQINQSEAANPVISSEIVKTEHNDNRTNKNKRKHKKHLIMNDSFSVEKHYFYENYLK